MQACWESQAGKKIMVAGHSLATRAVLNSSSSSARSIRLPLHTLRILFHRILDVCITALPRREMASLTASSGRLCADSSCSDHCRSSNKGLATSNIIAWISSSTFFISDDESDALNIGLILGHLV